jgi:predicted DNA-binding protein (UPF0251 family)
MKGKLGRATVLTPQVIELLCRIISEGHTHKTAYSAMAVSRDTFYRRLARDVNFRDKVARAETEAKKSLVSTVKRHSKDDWRAAAWILERTYRDEYGKAWADEHPGARIEVNINADEHARRLREIFGVKQAQVIDLPALPQGDNSDDVSNVD